MKMLAVSIGVALAQWGAGTALADSAVGVDMANGNTLNPPGRSAVPRPMAEGGYDTVRRSPTGQLYGVPYDVATETNKTEGGWEYTGGIEAGVLGGNADTKNALFRKYKDLNNSVYLNYFEIEADKAGTANYMSAFGGGTGQADQFYGIQFGRYNDWKARLFYNETQHVFSTNWRSLMNGEGTGNLTMPSTIAMPSMSSATVPGAFAPATAAAIGTLAAANGLTAQGTGNCSQALPCFSYNGKLYSNATAPLAISGIAGTYTVAGNVATLTPNSAQSGLAAAIAGKLDTMPDSELSLVRKKGGIRLDKTFTDNWKAYASYTQEARQGERPFSMVRGNNVSMEIAEPIDYTTHDFLAGFTYSDRLTQANVRFSASLFRNNIGTLNVQDPWLGSGNAVTALTGGIQTSTFDLYPDNNAFNLKGEFARSLPDFYHGRFNAAVSVGTSQQDDTLLAPISAAQLKDLQANGFYNPALATNMLGNIANLGYPTTGTLNINNWIDAQTALSQSTAKQRIDTALIDLGLAVKPTDALSVKGSARYYDSANKGGYMAYNPLTGQFGRGFNDGNAGFENVVGLLPGTLPKTAGDCYIPPGFSANALTNTCQFNLTFNNGSNIPVNGQARSTQQWNYGLSGDYDLTNTSSLNAAWEREDFTRNFRERDKTWEDKYKLGYVNRGLGDATLRTSYEIDNKRGSEYRYRTWEDLGTWLPGLSPAEQVTAAQALAANPADPKYAGYAALAVGLFNRYSYYFRKYDQADRDQNIFNLRLNYQAREDLDLGLAVQMKDAKYPNSTYGLDSDKQDSISLEANYQPASGSNIYASYGYQRGSKSMKLNSGVAGVTTTCSLANVAVYGYAACSDTTTGLDGPRPLTSAWSMNTDDRNNVIGIGFQTKIGTMQFGIDYTYAASTTDIGYNFGSAAFANSTAAAATAAAAAGATPATIAAATAAAAATQNAAALLAGSALPSMTYVQQTLNLNLLIPISKKLSVRLYDRLEFGGVTDWHYDGVIHNAVTNYDLGATQLDSGPTGYRANVIGFFIQYQL
jgi:hypothetical protein